MVNFSCFVHADFPVCDAIALAARLSLDKLPVSNHEIACTDPLRIPLSPRSDDSQPSDFGDEFLVQIRHLLRVRL